MDIFTQNKFLLRLVAVLVIVNFLCLGYLIWNKKNYSEVRPKRPFEQVAKLLSEKLNLSATQQQQFIKVRQNFFDKEEPLSQLIKSQRDSMNAEMFNEKTDTTLVKNLAAGIAQNEYQMELLRLNQAQELKQICTAEQLKKFKELVIDIRDYFQPRKK
jgi:hypothetical protein